MDSNRTCASTILPDPLPPLVGQAVTVSDRGGSSAVGIGRAANAVRGALGSPSEGESAAAPEGALRPSWHRSLTVGSGSV